MKVAAVVVSYNRKVLLLECLQSLLAQTRQLDRIFVVDNKSTDGTVELLVEQGLADHPLVTLQVLPENIGGAGGYEAGLRSAIEEGYDWVWLMDDDAEPELNAYETCLAHLTEDNSLVSPALADAAGVPDYSTSHRGILLSPKEASVDNVARPITEQQARSSDAAPINVCSFVGPFVSAKAVRSVGYPLKEFFIHFDDIEYSLRLGKVGRLVIVPDAIIKHKQAASSIYFVRNTLFGPRSRPRYDRIWATYFGYRNQAWLIRNRAVPITLSNLIWHHLKLLARIVAFDDQKYSRFMFYNSALLDGLMGVFDNSKPFRWKN